jgi:hypothetical protein
MKTLRAFALLAAVVVACGTKSQRGYEGSPADDAGSTGPGFGTDAGPLGTPATVGHLQGKVLAPEGTIPIAGALLYLTTTTPEPIPDHVYCDACVQIPPSTPFTYSGAYGTFDLPVYAAGSQQLVVQKGAFRRVRSIDVGENVQSVPADKTTLPSKTDKANGDDIPKMAVMVGAWDHIESSLAKLGLGKIDAQGNLVRGTEQFDLYEGAFPGQPMPFDPDKLLRDPATISKYHVVFFPCSGSDGTTCNDTQPGEPAVQTTLEGFVASGGKLYVTDYSYEYVRQPFPGRIDWEDATSDLGSACQADSYDAPAIVGDKGLGDWLGAIGETNVTLQQSWTTILHVNPVADTDANGKPVTVTPKVWVSAQKSSGPHPATVSFDRSCGRVLFSTYHTEGSGGPTLLAQEKALLYVLLEIAGVCIGTPPVK